MVCRCEKNLWVKSRSVFDEKNDEMLERIESGDLIGVVCITIYPDSKVIGKEYSLLSKKGNFFNVSEETMNKYFSIIEEKKRGKK